VKIKIGVMHVIAAEEASPRAESIKAWNRLLRKNMELVKAEGTEVTFQTPRRGFTSLHPFQYKYLNALNDMETLYGYMELEKAGIYDAIIGMCFFDPMGREVRQALDIPFIGPGEVAMRLAGLMGAKFGVVSIGDKANWTIEDIIRKYGLQDQAVPVRGLQVSFEDQMNALTDAHKKIEGFLKASKQLIADGAEVIIPGCMVMDPVLRFAPGCEKEYPNGIQEVDGIPVMNVVALTIKVAEAFAAMKKAGLPWISRKLYYTSAKKDIEALKGAASLLKYEGPGFWLD
jgi:allantoin racemase